MALLYRRAMDALYLACVIIAGTSLVLISAVIPWAVYTRYVINRAASWPEPTAVLLTIVLTFFGAAACYRFGLHMNVTLAVGLLPKAWRRVADVTVELLMATALRAIREMDESARGRKGDVDSLSATVLLQNALDTLK